MSHQAFHILIAACGHTFYLWIVYEHHTTIATDMQVNSRIKTSLMQKQRQQNI